MIATHEALIRLPGHSIATVRTETRDPIEALRLRRVPYGAVNVVGATRTLPKAGR